jgi:predicted RNA-binding protein YlqC (UPF0109 family)
MAEKDQAFVEYVAKELVEKPEGVKVARSVDEMGVLIELTVDKDDMGVIIGKEGKTAKAIRTLLRVLGAKNDARVNLKIVEPEGSERPAPKTEKTEEAEETKEEVKEEEAKEEEPVEEAKKEEKKEDEDERPMADLEL